MEFNFKKFEVSLKANLSRAGYKPALKPKEQALVVEKLDNMTGDQLQVAVQADFQHFIKIFMEFLHKYESADEVSEMARKLLQRFNKVFLESAQMMGGIEHLTLQEISDMYEHRILKMQLYRIGSYLMPRGNFTSFNTDASQNKLCMLKLLVQMIRTLDPNNVEFQIKAVAQKRRMTL